MRLENNSVFNFGKFIVENITLMDEDQFTYPISFKLDAEKLRNIYNFSEKTDVGYKISNYWEIHANLGIELASTLKSKISQEDIVITGGSYFKRILEGEKKSHIILGAGYYTFFGKPELYPIASYYKELSDDFSIEIGFPHTSISYNLNPKSNLKTTLDFNGKYVNLSNPVNIDWYNSAQKAELYQSSLKVEYNYILDNFWSFNLGAGYLLNNEYQLLNSNDHKIYNINTTSRPMFTAGIKFNLKTKP